MHLRVGRRDKIGRIVGILRQGMAGRVGLIAGHGGCPERMAMAYLVGVQRHLFGAANLPQSTIAQPGALAIMDRKAPAHVGKAESHAAVAAIGGSEQRVQRRELADCQQLTVAMRPVLWCEVEAEISDGTYEWR